MNKKFILPFLLLAVGGTAVTGCSKSISTPEKVAPYIADARGVYSDDQAIPLYVGDHYKTSFVIDPVDAKRSKLTYRIEGEEGIASVDKNGVVTGLKEGSVTLVCEVESNPEIKSVIPVHVFTKSTLDEAQSTAVKQKAYRDATYPEGVDTFECRESKTIEHVVEGVRFDGYDDYCNYNISKSQAYASFGGYEVDTKCAHGATAATNYKWTLVTDSNFVSYAYHETNGTKNRCILSTQSWMDDPTKTRFDVVERILDTMFRKGSLVIVDQNLESASGDDAYEDIEKYGSSIINCGIKENGFMYTLFQEGAYTVNRDTADNSGIPEGTKGTISIKLTEVVIDGFKAFELVEQTISYEREGKHYDYNIISHDGFYFGEDVSYEAPVDKDYNLVEGIFDL